MREKLDSQQIEYVEQAIKDKRAKSFGEGPVPKGYTDGRSRVFVVDGDYYVLIVDGGFTLAGEHVDRETAKRLI